MGYEHEGLLDFELKRPVARTADAGLEPLAGLLQFLFQRDEY